MATIVRANGQVEDIAPADGETFTLRELQQVVGGPIQMVRTLSGRTMLLHEEGKLRDLPTNEKATAVFGYPDTIKGDVIIFEPGSIELR